MPQVLLLNNDNQPLQYTSWKRAVVLLLKGKAEVEEKIKHIEDYIKVGEYYIPKCIRLKEQMAIPTKELPFSRTNIFKRDKYTCQYCGKHLEKDDLTIDHVFPKSRMGPDIWENLVTCCKECNQKKANKTPKEAHMKLIKRPVRPTMDDLDMSA